MKIWKNILIRLGFIVVFLFFYLQAAFASGELQISSANGKPFLFNPQPGETISEKIFVRNLSKTLSQNVKIYPQDATTTSDGRFDLLREDQMPKHVGTWIHILNKEITLKPGETREIPFTLTMPSKPEPGQYIGGILAQSEPIVGTKTKKSVNFRLVPRAGIFVTVNAPGEQIKSLNIEGFKENTNYFNNKLSFSFTINNTGNMSLAPKIAISLKDRKGVQIKNINIDAGYILPGHKLIKEIAIDNFAQIGFNKAELSVSYGDKKTINSLLDFLFLPLKKTTIVLGIILVIMVLVITVSRKFNIQISKKSDMVLEEAATREEV